MVVFFFLKKRWAILTSKLLNWMLTVPMFVLEISVHKFRGKKKKKPTKLLQGVSIWEGCRFHNHGAEKYWCQWTSVLKYCKKFVLTPPRYSQIFLASVSIHHFCFLHAVKPECLQLYLKVLQHQPVTHLSLCNEKLAKFNFRNISQWCGKLDRWK